MQGASSVPWECLALTQPVPRSPQRSAPKSHERRQQRHAQALVGLECDPPGQQSYFRVSLCVPVGHRGASRGEARRGMRHSAGHSRQSQQPLNRASRRVPGAQDTTAPGCVATGGRRCGSVCVSVPARLTLALPRPPTLPAVLSSDASTVRHARMPAHEQAAVRQVQVWKWKQGKEGELFSAAFAWLFLSISTRTRTGAPLQPAWRVSGWPGMRADSRAGTEALRPSNARHFPIATSDPLIVPTLCALHAAYTHADTLPAGQAGH